jgi:hypothetical protein
MARGDDVTVVGLRARLICTACGIVGADARADLVRCRLSFDGRCYRHIGQCGISSKHRTVHAATSTTIVQPKANQYRRCPPSNFLLVKFITRHPWKIATTSRDRGTPGKMYLGIAGADANWPDRAPLPSLTGHSWRVPNPLPARR